MATRWITPCVALPTTESRAWQSLRWNWRDFLMASKQAAGKGGQLSLQGFCRLITGVLQWDTLSLLPDTSLNDARWPRRKRYIKKKLQPEYHYNLVQTLYRRWFLADQKLPLPKHRLHVLSTKWLLPTTRRSARHAKLYMERPCPHLRQVAF